MQALWEPASFCCCAESLELETLDFHLSKLGEFGNESLEVLGSLVSGKSSIVGPCLAYHHHFGACAALENVVCDAACIFLRSGYKLFCNLKISGAILAADAYKYVQSYHNTFIVR